MLVPIMSEINVLYCFDTKFWHMAAVSMQSMLASAARDTRITFYCMVAPHTRGKHKLEKVIKNHPCGAGLVWREIKPSENPFQSYEYSRWSPVIFYRCFAHRVFPDIDRLLYLDSDTLICRDLTELFNTDLGDCALGAVRDLAPTNDKYHIQGRYVKDFSEKYLNNGEYYNSGVLLMDLKKMEECEKLLLTSTVPLFYPDQDLINAALQEKIKSLPLKYNLAPGLRVPKIFPEEQAKEALLGGHVIVHCYSVKPYHADRAPDAIYAMFSGHARAIGMKPEDFVKYEKKYTRHKIYDTFIPHIKIKDKNILFFGHEIKL